MRITIPGPADRSSRGRPSDVLRTPVLLMIPQFALRLIVGLSLMWCLLPRGLITSGFFRIQMLVTLGLSVLVALTAPQWEGLSDNFGPGFLRVGMIVTAIVSFVGSTLWTLERRRGGTIACFLVAACSMVLVASLQGTSPADGSPTWMRLIDGPSAGWLLGGLTGAMLLGHWYLTATGMPLRPLEGATRLAQAAVVVRLAVAILGTLLAPEGVRESLLGGHFVWTLLRWLAGLAGPLILTLMTPGTLKYRNTQSATGVLFAAVILAFIGEAAAILLRTELRWTL